MNRIGNIKIRLNINVDAFKQCIEAIRNAKKAFGQLGKVIRNIQNKRRNERELAKLGRGRIF